MFQYVSIAAGVVAISALAWGGLQTFRLSSTKVALESAEARADIAESRLSDMIAVRRLRDENNDLVGDDLRDRGSEWLCEAGTC